MADEPKTTNAQKPEDKNENTMPTGHGGMLMFERSAVDA